MKKLLELISHLITQIGIDIKHHFGTRYKQTIIHRTASEHHHMPTKGMNAEMPPCLGEPRTHSEVIMQARKNALSSWSTGLFLASFLGTLFSIVVLVRVLH